MFERDQWESRDGVYSSFLDNLRHYENVSTLLLLQNTPGISETATFDRLNYHAHNIQIKIKHAQKKHIYKLL